jgi:hypothetical protein
MGGVEQIKKDDKIGTKTLRTGRDLHFRRCVVRILTKKKFNRSLVERNNWWLVSYEFLCVVESFFPWHDTYERFIYLNRDIYYFGGSENSNRTDRL